ncbi:MAG TPA: class I SAM-dependent methyltransferase [Gemmatimonadaceae bacterium]|nr:class I SAM-dependent methyltransferase [Gemmatimonadaceae bacterium]
MTHAAVQLNARTFAQHPDDYQRFRPQYPAELLAYLASLCARREMALDCATGNGQAAVGLAEHFPEVIAADGAPAMLSLATRHPRVRYVAARCEALPFAASRFDLVTIAMGLHWVDRPAFYRELRRVARPGAVVAAWAYGHSHVGGRTGAMIREMLDKRVAHYWTSANHLAQSGYRGIDFPFEEVHPPPFTIRAHWTVDELLGYLRTWSAVRRYRAERGEDPVLDIERALRAEWSGDQRRTVTMAIGMRVGRVR